MVLPEKLQSDKVNDTVEKLYRVVLFTGNFKPKKVHGLVGCILQGDGKIGILQNGVRKRCGENVGRGLGYSVNEKLRIIRCISKTGQNRFFNEKNGGSCVNL